MSKSSHVVTFPLVALSLALLFSLLLAACSAGAGSLPQTPRNAVGTATPDTAVAGMITPEGKATGTATPNVIGGFDCASVHQIPTAECQALVALYDSTNGPDWADNSGWLTTNTPCIWSGITCTDGHVSHISLLYNQLTGTLPPELGDLSHLHVLELWVNQLSGPIPAEMGELSELVFLDLLGNQLSGPVPAELGDLTSLQSLSLNHNQFSGPIPPALGKMASLESLDLSYNQFSGAIPAELGDLTNLNVLRLSHNQLSDSIPVTFGNMSKLYELDLSYNQLSGAVPKSLGDIGQLRLWGNPLEETISAGGQGPIVVDYEGIHFIADSSLAESIRPEVVPANPAVEGEPIWYAGPEHIRFTFANPHLLEGRTRMGINLEPEAQILIYPLAELVEIDPWVQTQIETLQSLLAERGPVPEGGLPLLPNTNASQAFHAQAQYLDTGTVQGLRFISQHAQEVRPVNNQELFYTFQGLTSDGAYYVAVFFPVTTAVLPDKIEVEDWEAFSASFATYLAETTAVLEKLPPAEFNPDLTLLDAVVISLRVEADRPLSTETPAGG